MTKGSFSQWEIDRVLAMRADGYSLHDIGQAIGRHADSVGGLLRRISPAEHGASDDPSDADAVIRAASLRFARDGACILRNGGPS